MPLLVVREGTVSIFPTTSNPNPQLHRNQTKPGSVVGKGAAVFMLTTHGESPWSFAAKYKEFYGKVSNLRDTDKAGPGVPTIQQRLIQTP